MSLLVGEDLTGGYGGPDILQGCAIAAERGEITVVVGPNGAGKSTAMRALFGMLALRSGTVHLDGEDITPLAPQARAHKGMGFVPQTDNVFRSMTVQENLEMGAFVRDDDISGTHWMKSTGCFRRSGTSAGSLPASCRAVSASRWPSAGR